MYVAGEAVPCLFCGIRHTVDAHVDDDGSGLHHISSDELGLADGGDKNIGLPGNGGQICGLGMADGDGGVGPGLALHGEQGGGFADDETAS